jgi:hypothetical protein
MDPSELFFSKYLSYKIVISFQIKQRRIWSLYDRHGDYPKWGTAS